jgi:hypothetical protein
MSLEQAVDIETKILKYMRDLIVSIFESETKYKIVGRIGDYLAYQLPDGDYMAVDITGDVTPESKYTTIIRTPAFKDQNELNIYLSNLMIDKYISMKRDLELEAGLHQYGTPYL